VEWTVAGETLDWRLAGLGVHAGVAHLLGPGREAIIELLEAGDAVRLSLEQEPLPDVSQESFLFATRLRPVRPTVDQPDAEHGAGALEGGIAIRRSVVHQQLFRQAAALDRGAQHITIQPKAYWGDLNGSQLALYGESGSPAVVTWSLRKGEVLWWAGSTPLTNAGITRDDNLAFFLNSVANWSGNEPLRILWDEYFHGQRSSLWSYLGKTSLAWGVLQLGLLAAAVIFTFSRRSGPIYVPAGRSRLSPLEFVDTLGGLYERAGAASSAVSVSYLRLRSLLTRHLGFPSNMPAAELERSAKQRLGWKDAGLADLLGRAEASCRMPKLSPRVALDLVQKLEQYSARLNVRTQVRKEKN